MARNDFFVGITDDASGLSIMLVSIVIRTLNEQRHLSELLTSIQDQETDGFSVESVVIDSGSTDDTLKIASSFGCRITHINRREFTFGRSLNMGCEFADGQILVFVSGHCITASRVWLKELIRPIRTGLAQYTYGKQVGRDTTKFSEVKLFEKYFPNDSKIPQEGFFVNNANSAIAREVWEKLKFDEFVTGLEDMELAKRMVDGEVGLTAYVSEAPVYHIHDETWSQTESRYEREAIALQKIMPEVHVHSWTAFRYFWAGIGVDYSAAVKQGILHREWLSILKFRAAQFIGTYRGNHEHRMLSRTKRERYYYPSIKD